MKSLPAKLQGIVTQFAGNGRKLGYPTANIASSTELDDGVYFGKANLSGYADWPALIFVGTPVTVGDAGRRVEAHLLDIANEDYYGEKLELDILQLHRSNQKFNSIDELLTAMKADEAAGREWFKTS